MPGARTPFSSSTKSGPEHRRLFAVTGHIVPHEDTHVLHTNVVKLAADEQPTFFYLNHIP